MTTGEADIDGSLEVLFSTKLEERLFRPKYGTSMEEFLFKPMTMAAVNRISDIIGDAVRKFEKRIRVRNVDVRSSAPAEGKLHVVLQYTIREDLSEDGTVYVFHYDFD
jgi:phage baseplate assembly protein W